MRETQHNPLKKHIHDRLGPILRRLIPSSLPIEGHYPSYAAALADATGYDCMAIRLQVESVVRALVSGEVAYERDGIGYREIPSNLMVRKLLEQHLRSNDIVVDFGGGLGSTFLNHADLFSSNCQKIVVEQPLFAKRGEELSNSLRKNIYFQDSLEGIEKADIVLASSVLQYIDNYTDILRRIVAVNPRLIIIDRTAFASRERWHVQRCHGYGGQATRIPIRPIQQSKLIEALGSYQLLSQWSNQFDPGRPVHRGLLFGLKGKR